MRIPSLSDIAGLFNQKDVRKSFVLNEKLARPNGNLLEQFKELERYQRTNLGLYAEYSDTIRIINLTLETHIFRNGLEIKEKFACKCTECDHEYAELKDSCEHCGGNLREPDTSQKERLEKFIKCANSNKQNLLDVLKTVERDFTSFDDTYILLEHNYLFKDGILKGAEFKEAVRIDPIWLRLRQDRTFTYGKDKDGNDIFFCINHRNIEQKSKTCDICGYETFPVWYSYEGYNQTIAHYGEFEVIHAQKYYPSLHYGDPPIRALLPKLKALMGQDTYILQTYSMLRPPNGIIAISSANPDGVDEAIGRARDEHLKNPLEPLYLSLQSDKSVGANLQFVDLMRTNSDMQFIEMRNEFRRICLAAYGISPMFSGDVQSAGGLSNESRQLQVLDDTIEFGQSIYNNKILCKFIDKLLITDYELIIAPAIEKDKLEEVTLKKANAEYAILMQQLGYDVSINSKGEFVFKKKENVPQLKVNYGQLEQSDEMPSVDEIATKTNAFGIEKSEIKKKESDVLEDELTSMLNEELSKIKEKPSREAYETLIKRILEKFDRKIQPAIEKEIKNIVMAEWEKIEKKYKRNIVLTDKERESIKQAVSNTYLDQSINDFNKELSERLVSKLGDKDITLSNLVGELKQTMIDRESRLVNIARTESTKAANMARFLAYDQIKKPRDKYTWSIVRDSRTTGVCKRIYERAKNGVGKDELIEIIKQESSKDFPDWTVNDLQPCAHYQCRSLVSLKRD